MGMASIIGQMTSKIYDTLRMFCDLVKTTGSFSMKTRLLFNRHEDDKFENHADCDMLATTREVSVPEICKNVSSDWRFCEAKKQSMFDRYCLLCCGVRAMRVWEWGEGVAPAGVDRHWLSAFSTYV
jgi:hypothetical protein